MSTTPSDEPSTEPAKPVEVGARRVARTVVVAAPAQALFARLANPRMHAGLDGSGTVVATVSGPEHLALGDQFITSMKMLGLPYKTTSTITAFDEPQLIEWEMQGGHRWRWELHALSPKRTQVTEVFDYHRSKGARALEILGMPKRNGRSIESTLNGLRDHYATGVSR